MGRPYYRDIIKIHLEYLPYYYMDKTNCKVPKNRSSAGSIYIENRDKYENAIVLMRNPFDTIYAMKQILDDDTAYYHFLETGNIDIYPLET